jgi:hypothetical protein
MHNAAQQFALCIGDDVALATFDLLARIKTVRSSALGRLDRMAVERVISVQVI